MGSASGDSLGTDRPQGRGRDRPPGAPPDQEEPRVPQPGLFHLGGLLRRCGQHPGAPCGADAVEVVAEEASETDVHRREQPAGDEDPRLGDRVALRGDHSARLAVADDVREEVVHLAHLPAKRRCDHAILRRLGERLDPQVDEPDPRALRHVGVGDRAETAVRIVRDRLLADRAEARPRLVEAREIEVALRAEVAIEDRLADPGLARDLCSRRTAVARLGEDAAGGVQYRLPPGLGGEPKPCRGHAASTAGCCAASSWWCSSFRIAAVATTAPASASTAATRSASWKPCRNASGVREPAAPDATIAPMTAIPSDPPTCRAELSTADP